MLPLTPRPRVFGNGPAPDVVDVPVPATLERLLQHDPYARDLILRASEQYKQGDMHCVESPAQITLVPCAQSPARGSMY